MATDFDGSHLGWAARMGDALVGVQTTIDGWRFSPRVVAAWILGALACACGLWLVFGGDEPASVESLLPRAGTTSLMATGSVPGGTAPLIDGTSGVTASAAAVMLVHVVGAVSSPGVVEVPTGARVHDAVDAAGGMALVADPERMNLAAKVADGQRVVVPVVGENPPVMIDGSAGSANVGAATSGPTPESPLDLNSATEAQLDALPGVGPATAAAIVSHRDQHGAFRSVDALADVRGIGPAKLDQIRPLVSV